MPGTATGDIGLLGLRVVLNVTMVFTHALGNVITPLVPNMVNHVQVALKRNKSALQGDVTQVSSLVR